MRALIMAGGAGSRLNSGEKPLILIHGQPMIAYVIRAFEKAGCEPVVAASPKTPMTVNWCHAHGVAVCRAEGKGFVDDMVHAVQFLEEEDPLFVSVSDIPCVTSDIVRSVMESYHSAGTDALSTWIPANLVKSCRGGMPYRECINGIESCPAGINILRADRIDKVQDEYALLLDDPCLALNVNTPADRAAAETFMRQRETGISGT
ncbi:NTP transferase domain-containing protein [Methanoregula sp.]|uniref:NTP transferase domain-containing protein n=1 Tax=Methanoregula sp. TaxID=2052170 RepID=UPI002372B5E9|nr:NTP transferase domain-containing protein [Methanoregula sp.]MDD1685928.1 NTP transferase domain-containing protein [Methanoregula sp.]